MQSGSTIDWNEGQLKRTIHQGWKPELLMSGTARVDCRAPKEPYYGREIGELANFGHGIKGHVYAVDESTLFVKGFAYDGNAPDAFFWVGNSPRPSPEGYIIPYPEEYSGRRWQSVPKRLGGWFPSTSAQGI
uniref:DM13 domain-containing protein n=1 Tax=Anopheles culicifacies TaxID=139723 RepID=A0A182MTS3_9DIPT